jgi:hypothetical protein
VFGDDARGKMRLVSLRFESMRPLIVAVATLVGVLALAGCFTSKISAARTAAILASRNPSWKRVSCRPYKRTGWDYTCRVDSLRVGRFSFEVTVDGSEITNQSAP